MHRAGQSNTAVCGLLQSLKRPLTVALSSILLLTPVAMAGEMDWSSLDLSEEQAEEIEHLETDWEKTHAEVSAQIDRDMAELRDILPNGDAVRIRQLQNRITTNKMYLMNTSMDTFLKKRDALTPPQRRQLQQMLPVKHHRRH